MKSEKMIFENSFESLIESYIENKIGIDTNFLTKNLADKLKVHLLNLHDNKQFLSAGVGNTENLVHNKSIRSDTIYWLDRNHDNSDETDFLNLIDDFIKHLNMSCYAGITNSEFHFSIYEKEAFYKKHLDQFQNNSNRKYSMISYLNADWIEADGGELLIHTKEKNQSISPTQGKTVFFKSDELVHEVLVTNKRRLSITGWLKGQ